jgi:hypothetical protein
MKIAFLAPAGAMHRYSGSFSKSLHYAPLTLTTLAALVPEELEADLVIHDETAGRIPLDWRRTWCASPASPVRRHAAMPMRITSAAWEKPLSWAECIRH